MGRWALGWAVLGLAHGMAGAQALDPPAVTDPVPAAVAGQKPDQPPDQPPACDCLVIPALTIVDIEIVDAISSATAKTGESFAIRLASPIIIAGRVAVAAGTGGLGEVIHAQKSSMGGGGGELLLAARYLEVDGRRLRLRSFRAGRFGQNQTGAAMATSIALGPLGLAVKGRNTEFAAGAVAEAKVAEAFVLPIAMLPAADRPAPAPTDSTQENVP